MNFPSESKSLKTNWKYILIILILSVFVGGGILWWAKTQEVPFTQLPDKFIEKDQSFSCGISTVKDIDGNIYKTVQIGSQCWLKENLKVTKNSAGEAITRYCYDNDPKICDTDGGLYDWNTAMNGLTTKGAQGICPNGWHIPKDSEWYALEYGLATGSCSADRDGWDWDDWGCDPAEIKLKTGGSSGFQGILAGERNTDGSFRNRGTYANFWSSTESEVFAWGRSLSLADTGVYRHPFVAALGFSVRCLKEVKAPEEKVEEVVPEEITEDEIDETAGWQTYRNEEYGFEVKYPKELITSPRFHFIVKENTDDYIVIIQDSFEREYPCDAEGNNPDWPSYPCGSYSPYPFWDGLGIKAIKLLGRSFEEVLEDVLKKPLIANFDMIGPVIIGKDIPAISGRRHSNKFVGYEFYIKRQDEIIMIAFGYEEIFEKILSTFRFLE